MRVQRERMVDAALRNKGYATFLPARVSFRSWSDRLKKVELPLFPGYLFCLIDPASRLPVLVTPGVVKILGEGKQISPVDTAEIKALMQAAASGLAIEPCAYLTVGEKVRVCEGPLAGMDGIIMRTTRSQTLVISVTLIRRSVAVEIDREAVAPRRQCGIDGRLEPDSEVYAAAGLSELGKRA